MSFFCSSSFDALSPREIIIINIVIILFMVPSTNSDYLSCLLLFVYFSAIPQSTIRVRLCCCTQGLFALQPAS